MKITAVQDSKSLTAQSKNRRALLEKAKIDSNYANEYLHFFVLHSPCLVGARLKIFHQIFFGRLFSSPLQTLISPVVETATESHQHTHLYTSLRSTLYSNSFPDEAVRVFSIDANLKCNSYPVRRRGREMKYMRR